MLRRFDSFPFRRSASERRETSESGEGIAALQIARAQPVNGLASSVSTNASSQRICSHEGSMS
jgi:hypothetical protein